MRLTPEQYAALKAIVARNVEMLGAEVIERHRVAILRVAKDPAKRLRWDLFWCGAFSTRPALMQEIYATGANDEHVDTALRRIVKELGVRS
jgi:hypothetical protein